MSVRWSQARAAARKNESCVAIYEIEPSVGGAPAQRG
jgi:hypothetical protein